MLDSTFEHHIPKILSVTKRRNVRDQWSNGYGSPTATTLFETATAYPGVVCAGVACLDTQQQAARNDSYRYRPHVRAWPLRNSGSVLHQTQELEHHLPVKKSLTLKPMSDYL